MPVRVEGSGLWARVIKVLPIKISQLHIQHCKSLSENCKSAKSSLMTKFSSQTLKAGFQIGILP